MATERFFLSEDGRHEVTSPFNMVNKEEGKRKKGCAGPGGKHYHQQPRQQRRYQNDDNGVEDNSGGSHEIWNQREDILSDL